MAFCPGSVIVAGMEQEDKTIERAAIFDFDIPCPHCEYNLRGLIEPRCPECGRIFDPYKVLHDFRETQPPLPILWVIRSVYNHPLRFWGLREVRRSRGPRRLQLFFALLYVPAALAMICVGLITSWGRPWQPGPAELLAGALFGALPYCLILYMLVLVHGILCRLGLIRSTAREGVRAAKEVVGYGLVWFAPVLVGVLLVGPYESAARRGIPSLQDQVLAAGGLAIVAASCLAWAITIYQGARFVSGGSRAVAIWCTAANPFWYLLGLAAILTFG